MVETIDVVIIGAGHIGLSTSFFLQKARVSHVILEKADVASTWSTQRWDSFNLVLPNWSLKLPEFPYQGTDPDGFLNLSTTIKYIQDFAKHFKLPVRSGFEVLELGRENNYYLLKTNRGEIKCKSVIIATGAYQQPKIPEISKLISKSVKQIHSSQYRNPSQVSKGSVLIVGTGQSGAQIADELYNSKRKVFLSVSRCGGRPRRYRGQDCVWWMNQRGFYDQKVESISTEKQKLSCNVPLTGQNGGVDINLNAFAAKGIQLLGRISNALENQLTLENDLSLNLKHADNEWEQFLLECDAFAELQKLSLPLEPTAYEFKKCEERTELSEINLLHENITEIVWATGFSQSYPWISLPLSDSFGFPQQQKGITQEPGLFFVGLPWQSKRKSSIFLGSTEDAQFISEQVIKHLFTC